MEERLKIFWQRTHSYLSSNPAIFSLESWVQVSWVTSLYYNYFASTILDSAWLVSNLVFDLICLWVFSWINTSSKLPSPVSQVKSQYLQLYVIGYFHLFICKDPWKPHQVHCTNLCCIILKGVFEPVSSTKDRIWLSRCLHMFVYYYLLCHEIVIWKVDIKNGEFWAKIISNKLLDFILNLINLFAWWWNISILSNVIF